MGFVHSRGLAIARRVRRCTSIVASATTILLLSLPSGAVESPPTLGEPGLRDANTPSSIPNISGVWQVRGFERQTKPIDGSAPPWLPWNKEAVDKRMAAEKAGAPLYDPTAACLPSGMPRIIAAPYPVEIVQTPQATVFLYEAQHLFRVVYMNEKHPKKIEPSYMGHSVGHWEGDTLVIDTVGLVDSTQIDEAGSMHSEDLHVVERIRRVNDTLEIDFTMTDPKAFSEPWTSRRIWRWRPEVRFLEYVCEENNRNAPDENGVLRNF
jgi:hypothetical protein